MLEKFLLDTNIVSETMKPKPNKNALVWLENQNLDSLFLSSISVAELRSGVAMMPNGKRKNQIFNYLENDYLPKFFGRILNFNLACSAIYAKILSQMKTYGKSISTMDALIASTAIANDCILVSRDIKPFMNLKNIFTLKNFEIINPFEIM